MAKLKRYSGLFVATMACSFTAAAGVYFAPRVVDVPGTLRDRLKSFEPSAAIYLADLDRYLVGSDDTTKGNLPWLFLMDANGRVASEPVVVAGLKKMTDIESMSEDGGSVYLLSSLGLNKNGEEKPDRNLFVRAKRSGAKLSATGEINLRKPLIAALESSNLPPLKAMRGRFEAELDIESSIVKDGLLYVGIKNPQPRPGLALILSLGKVDNLFAFRRATSLEIYAEIDFGKVTGDADAISDMHYQDGSLFFTSTTEGKVGRFWKYLPKEGRLTKIRDFPAMNPEAVTFGKSATSSLLLFDQGEEEGLFSFEANSLRYRRYR